MKSPAIQHTFWKNHCPHYTFPPVFSSSGHHSDGVACVVLEVGQGGTGCCWVTELQGGLATSLRTVGHRGGVEAVGSWAWTIPLPYHPNTWGIYELSSDRSGSGRCWSGDCVNYSKLNQKLPWKDHTHTSCWQRNHSRNTCCTRSSLNIINPDCVLCVALEVGQGGTSCCCTVHCVHH